MDKSEPDVTLYLTLWISQNLLFDFVLRRSLSAPENADTKASLNISDHMQLDILYLFVRMCVSISVCL